MSLKKRAAGDPIQISASEHNAMIDAARDFQDRVGGRGTPATPRARRGDMIAVKNESGATRGQYEVLALSEPVITPSDNPAGFRERVIMRGVEPTAAHAGAFAVLAGPINRGEIGRAYVCGTCPVRIKVNNETDTYADAIDGDCRYLGSAPGGSARILWKQAEEDRTQGNDIAWAVVVIATNAVPGVFIATANESGGFITVKAVNADGGTTGDAITLAVLP